MLLLYRYIVGVATLIYGLAFQSNKDHDGDEKDLSELWEIKDIRNAKKWYLEASMSRFLLQSNRNFSILGNVSLYYNFSLQISKNAGRSQSTFSF